MTTEPTVAPVAETVPVARSGSDSFFNSIRRLNLVRTDDRWIGGVAAGIAHRLGWDPMIVRGLFVISFFFGGLPLVYGVAWALLPEASDGRIHLQEALNGRFDPAIIGAGLMILAGLVSNGPLSWVTHRIFSWNTGLFSLISGLFWGVFSTVAIVLFIRWLIERHRFRKHLKALPDYESGVTASTAVIEDERVDSTSDLDTKAQAKLAARQVAEERTREKAEAAQIAAAEKAEARVQAHAERAYYRQQRDIEKYQKAVERSRRPITKGPGLVTLLLTLGSLFLVWTAAQAAIRGLMPAHFGSTIGNPVLWAGIALLIVGLGIFVSGIRGRRSGILNGLAWVGTVAMIPLSILSAGVFGGQVAWSTGATDWIRPAATAQAIGTGVARPINLANAELGFQGRFGSPVIDLTELDLSHATTANPVTIPIEFSAGDVTVLLPPEARVEANVRLSTGFIYWQVTEPYEAGTELTGQRRLAEDIDVWMHDGENLIRTTQTFEATVANPLRSAVYVASDAARLDGANLRLAISNGAGNVILRETAPVTAPAAELVNQ